MSNLISSEYDDLRKAYQFCESVEKDSNLKIPAKDVVTAFLTIYNESCDEWEDELDADELNLLFGEL